MIIHLVGLLHHDFVHLGSLLFYKSALSDTFVANRAVQHVHGVMPDDSINIAIPFESLAPKEIAVGTNAPFAVSIRTALISSIVTEGLTRIGTGVGIVKRALVSVAQYPQTVNI